MKLSLYPDRNLLSLEKLSQMCQTVVSEASICNNFYTPEKVVFNSEVVSNGSEANITTCFWFIETFCELIKSL